MKTIVSSLTPVISLLILALVAFVAIRGCREQQVLYNTERITQIQRDTVYHWEDRQGRNHGVVRLSEADAASLRAVYPFLDSVMQVLKIQRKQLNALTTLSVTTAARIQPDVSDVRMGDRDFKRISYADRWLQLEGVIADTPFINYSTFDSLVATTYTKRKWLLGSKETFLDAYSLNPNARVTGLAGLRVAVERPKRFGIGPFVGYGFDGQRWAPSVGLSLQYSLIKF